MKKQKVLNIDAIEKSSSEWQKNSDLLAAAATSEQAGINLIVAGLKIMTIFSDEAEGNFGPLGIAPHGSNNKGDKGKAGGLEGFNIVEEVIGGFTFKIMDG
jgi:hypothetical protein